MHEVGRYWRLCPVYPRSGRIYEPDVACHFDELADHSIDICPAVDTTALLDEDSRSYLPALLWYTRPRRSLEQLEDPMNTYCVVADSSLYGSRDLEFDGLTSPALFVMAFTV